jgi:hypothetical protein
MKVEMLRARKGDCLLLHGGSEDEPALILIDGGPAGTYEESLRPRLMRLREERQLGDDERLVIDLVIVSHVDDDHINGIIDLFREIKDEGGSALFEVKALWHNSFDDILNNDEVRAQEGQFGAASFAPLADEAGDQTEWDAAMLLAGVGQGQQLRELASEHLGITPNEDFGGGKLIQTPDTGRLVKEVGGIAFTVVAPRAEELLKLQRDHDKWLKKKREKGEPVTPASFLASLTDKSVANLSSIVVLAQADGRTMLLTGDARTDHVIIGLEKTGLIAPGGTMEVEILKMPHHGSDRNVDEAFLERVRGRSYLFSGNGEHGNPERKTVEMLLDAQPDAEMCLYFTYPFDEVDAEREHEHRGAAWSDDLHGLGKLLENPRAGVSIAVSGEEGIEVAKRA